MRRRLVLGMKGTQNWAAQRPREKGPLARGRECANPSRSRRSLPPVSGPPPPLGGLCCYLFISSIHPPPILVSHPCLSSSARPLSHSFWRSVSCCGPHRLVQGSHPYQRGSGCWLCVFNTEVTAFPRAASPPIPLWLAHMAWNLFCDPRVDVLGRCGAFFSLDFGMPRTGSSSAVHSGSLDSLLSSPGTSSFSAWALGLR